MIEDIYKEDQQLWESIAEELQKNVENFKVLWIVDESGETGFKWRCRNEKGKRVTSTKTYITHKECVKDLFDKIVGFKLEDE